VLQETRFHIGLVDGRCYLMAVQSGTTKVTAVPISLTSRAVANVLTGSASDESEAMLSDTPAHALISYFYLIFEKYSGRPALGDPISPTQVHFLLPPGARAEYGKGILEHTEELWEGLKDQTKKDFRGVEFDFAVQMGWGMPGLPEHSVTTLAELIATAITRVPIQMCRVEGGKLLPMSDGQRLRVNIPFPPSPAIFIYVASVASCLPLMLQTTNVSLWVERNTGRPCNKTSQQMQYGWNICDKAAMASVKYVK